MKNYTPSYSIIVEKQQGLNWFVLYNCNNVQNKNFILLVSLVPFIYRWVFWLHRTINIDPWQGICESSGLLKKKQLVIFQNSDDPLPSPSPSTLPWQKWTYFFFKKTTASNKEQTKIVHFIALLRQFANFRMLNVQKFKIC